MARIEGIDLPRNKRVEIGLTYLYGIGPTRSREILAGTGINPDTRIQDLTESEVTLLRDYIAANYVVEGNLRRVHEATDGRVAYVYVPNTSTLGHTYFKRYFYPQAHKNAIIVDERFNGGGSVADYYIDILRRPFISNWAMRSRLASSSSALWIFRFTRAISLSSRSL